MAARTALRAATEAEHARLDNLFDRFDLADADDYGRFLLAHAGALLAVEQGMDIAGADRIVPGWPDRHRSALIRADLDALGLDTPDPLPFAPPADDAACWGTAYVVEGSRLGGALLARRVADGLPRTYLSAVHSKGAWRGFVAALDQALTSDDRIDRAVHAARVTFGLFETAGHRHLESPAR